ncbi:protein NDH-DEPENDENT CYCLIC ELECTRON FLOW 5 [Mercurialis annua]|uniref:protein NDH-DEPENDENT CYCLIC ELECTRON FLOW 5 n=1 Tax=Mercurialis annua TaxID=3986 RepID=UPI00215E89E9|nr:protein NDH-DEPENDENT CYCLIC ELECTRON FLOW 5 [Mercurialis annua]
MASTALFSLTVATISSSTLSTNNQCSFNSYNPSISLNKKRELSLPSVASIPYQPINVDYLEQEFSGHGVTFEDIGDNCCIAKLKTENGSSATLMLPSGLITSYKAHMWHGGTAEVLHTSVLEGEDGNPMVQGGVSFAFNFESDDEVTWSPSNWTLRTIQGNSDEYIQVELISTDDDDNVEVKHILSLTEDTLISEIVVSNAKSSSIRLMGSLISHLTVSTPEATYAYGLEGSDFFNRPLFASNFSIVPPDLGKETPYGPGKVWNDLKLNGFFPDRGEKDQKDSDEEEIEGEEDENYKQLTDAMSRIYTSAPSQFTIIDRGRRNSVVVGRVGFDELYMSSPGSSHEMYGMYSYICVGQSAMLKPVILSPGDVWKGGQQLHNPNL